MSPGNSDARPFKAIFRPGPKGIMDPIPTVPGNQSRYITLLAYSLITNYPQRFKSVQDVLGYLVKKHIIKTGEKSIRSIEKAVRKRKTEDMYGSSIDTTFDTTPVGYRMKMGERRMYITKKALKQIVKEEVARLNEDEGKEQELQQLQKIKKGFEYMFGDEGKDLAAKIPADKGQLQAMLDMIRTAAKTASKRLAKTAGKKVSVATASMKVDEDDDGTDEIAPLPSP